MQWNHTAALTGVVHVQRRRRCARQGWVSGHRVYKFQSRESAAVKEHNRLSILKCSDVLHYNKNVTRGLRVRGNIVGGARAAATWYIRALYTTAGGDDLRSRKNSLWGENDFRP